MVSLKAVGRVLTSLLGTMFGTLLIGLGLVHVLGSNEPPWQLAFGIVLLSGAALLVKSASVTRRAFTSA
ncbi:hypothetical protein C499_09659 [Halogeometricum borinquense DSM 11551]|uniref:Uncharacterized protein n=2 Tax=Halogeometricum borinquense TaxID=60847 RepID=E4NMN1_HALBP|nr:hypothetical protein [Halogeometricum borinquense]ADQ66186.1 hypothetical protein Hbor_05850 [Halogeometricum borinquense DSM 11551]ELY27319.1 hypothetical protein C499_09659 [Halogeometricum borinquense DSM 11551]RYJ14780.1 hypothetical protein ELS19_13005 [Halogeometricum borinquense]